MIYKKYQDFKKLGITIKRDATNPHFKNEYSTLDEVLDKVVQPLLGMDVIIVQEPTVEGLKTRLIDTSDMTEMSGVMPWVGADNAQKMLACVTYYRRGSLVSMLGLEDSDDDGNTASAPKPVTKAKSVVEAKGEPFVNSVEQEHFNGGSDLADIKWD